ncbi:endonuclease [Escherichia coli]|nr:endonuclease [Escherichia coli]EGB0972450.1 endonuclease [Escherichia coli]
MKKYIPVVLFVFSCQVFSADIHGRGVRVLDGNTIDVMLSQHPVRVRLVNIDAPEKKQEYGRWSEKIMKSLVAGKTVTVTYFQRDHYDRILGQVYAPDGMNVNQFMSVQAMHGFMSSTTPILFFLSCREKYDSRNVVCGQTALLFRPGYGAHGNNDISVAIEFSLKCDI